MHLQTICHPASRAITRTLILGTLVLLARRGQVWAKTQASVCKFLARNHLQGCVQARPTPAWSVSNFTVAGKTIPNENCLRVCTLRCSDGRGQNVEEQR